MDVLVLPIQQTSPLCMVNLETLLSMPERTMDEFYGRDTLGKTSSMLVPNSLQVRWPF